MALTSVIDKGVLRVEDKIKYETLYLLPEKNLYASSFLHVRLHSLT